MSYSKFKVIRGIQKVLSGKLPDFLVPVVEKIKYRNWYRFEKGLCTELVWPVGVGARLKLRKTSFLCRPIVRGNFEIGERKLLERLLKKGDVFVDVGANIGLFTVIAGKCVGPNGLVLAVEPSSSTCEILQGQIDLNKLHNVQVCQVGLSNEDGELELYQGSDSNDTFNSFGTPIWEGAFKPVRVPVRTFDSLMAERLAGRAVRLVKIDTEGWECSVLAGGKQILASPEAPDLIIEFCEKALKAGSSSCEALYRAVTDYGYTCFVIDGENGSLKTLSQPQVFEYANIFATKFVSRCREMVVA